MEKGSRQIGTAVSVAAGLAAALSLPVLSSGPLPPGESWSDELAREAPSKPGRGTLHLVFQAGDCIETLDALRTVGRVARSRDLAVGGIVVDGARRLDVLREAGAFPFPLRSDRRKSTSRMLRSLGFRRTPVILLTDPRGRLLAALPGPRSDSPQTPEELIRHAEALLDAES